LRIKKPDVNEEIIVNFLERNKIDKFKIDKEFIIINKDNEYNQNQLESIKRHFNYFDIFMWSNRGIENILLWEKPDKIRDVINDFNKAFSRKDYSLITSIEAKGFILGGIFMSQLSIPFLPIRKYKILYNSFDGEKEEFKNWKNQKESLFMFDNNHIGKKAILVDDLLHTGNSLKAAVKLLQKFKIEVKGAFYLADYSKVEVRNQFNFPIKSLLRYNDLLTNCY
jgi:adenine phosphoribosyltransferase